MKRNYYYGYLYDGINLNSLQAFDTKAERDEKLQTSKDVALTRKEIDDIMGRGKWVIATDGSHSIIKKAHLMMEG